MNKRGQLKISFGMIFGIILTIIFIAFAIYAASKFLNMSKGVQIESFNKNLQTDIENVWQSSQGSDIYVYPVPKSVIRVCFMADEQNNFRIIMEKSFKEYELKYVDITEDKCFTPESGKIKIRLQKDFNERLVSILEP